MAPVGGRGKPSPLQKYGKSLRGGRGKPSPLRKYGKSLRGGRGKPSSLREAGEEQPAHSREKFMRPFRSRGTALWRMKSVTERARRERRSAGHPYGGSGAYAPGCHR